MKAKILVIDDDPDVLRLLQVTLESAGYSPSLAGDGETALRRIEADHPDLVLLDVMMPLLDGWAVLEQVGTMQHPPRVVVISAKAGQRDVARGLALGACEYVTKPFRLDALVATVGDVLRRPPGDQERLRRSTLAALRTTAP